MEDIRGKFEGDLNLGDNLNLHGMVTGRITVMAGGHLNLYGTCNQLVIEPGGHAYVNGMVTGDAENRGGHLEVFGIISGTLREVGGTTYVDPKAKVSHRS